MSPKAGSIKILTTIIGYGIYFPAVLIKEQLLRSGISAELYIVEKLLSPEKKTTFQNSKNAYKKNFRLAQLAAKLPVVYSSSFDPELVQEIYNKWDCDGGTEFLIFSGMWFEILAGYQPPSGIKNIRVCRVDTGEAPTWRNKKQVKIDYTYYLCHLGTKEVRYTFDIPTLPKIPFRDRKRALMVHGGGWALGNFVEKTEEIELNGYQRNVIIKDLQDYKSDLPHSQFYLNDPTWDPLEKDTNHHFPPIGVIKDNREIDYEYYPTFHASLKLMSEGVGVIAKPGGMTLADSIISETPIIYLEPMGPNEEGNRVIIEECGIGTSFEAWKESGFSYDLLLQFHHNLKSLKKNVADITSTYIKDLNLTTNT